MNVFNSKMFAAELLHTFVGCIGIVLVSLLTSLICWLTYKRKIYGDKPKPKSAAVLAMPPCRHARSRPLCGRRVETRR